MTVVWCPRCQQQVAAKRRDSVDPETQTKRVVLSCPRCLSTLSQEDLPTERAPQPPDGRP